MLQPIFMQLALKRSLSTFVGVVHCRASALSQLVEPLNSPQQQLNGPPENGAAPGQLSPAHTAHSGAAFATLRAPGHGAWARPAVNRGVVAPSLMMRHASLGAHRYGTLVAFPLAQTGEGISECELIQWFVAEGDNIQEFDKLAEVQSDKASIEITSRYTGVVRKLHHQKGDVVKVGAALVDIEVEGDLPQGAAPASATSCEPTISVTAVEATTVTAASSSDTSGIVTAAAGITTAAVTAMSQPAPVTPTTAAPVFSLSSPHSPSQVLHAAAAAKGPATHTSSHSGAPGTVPSVVSAGRPPSGVLTSPAVRRLARESGVDLNLVTGTGDKGRITREDVLQYLEARATGISPVAAAPAAAVSAGVPFGAQAAPGILMSTHTPPSHTQLHAPAVPAPEPGTTARLPVRGYRRAMVKSMTAAASIPHFHYHDEICMDALMTARRMLAGHPALGGVKLTLLPFIIKALSVMLSQHPLLNASLAPDGTELLLHGSHNVGVAMATPQGLVVPAVRGVQALTVVQIAHEVARLQAAAAANKLCPEDLTGSTISVSNIGTIGGLFANPLVNPPEAAIVALGRVRPVPALGSDHTSTKGHTPGTISSHAVMGVSWGADHRVVDGAGLAHACNTWKALLENPHAMLLHLR